MKNLSSQILFLSLLLVGLGWPGTALADLPGTEFTYQGTLDDDGIPADGLYDFRFRLFDAVTGTPITSFSTHLNILVTNGLFAITDVDFGEDLDIATLDAELGISVREAGAADYEILSPRIPLGAAPLASQLRGVSLETNTHGTVMRSYDDGETGAEWGTGQTGSGFFRGWAKPGATNVRTVLLDADRDNDPGNGTAEGLLRLGASGSSANGGWLEIQSATGETTIRLVGGLTGDAAVQFPAAAVTSDELADEPGEISAIEGGVATTLNPNFGGPTVLQSGTIDCPDAGYVLVIGTCQLTASHVTGTRTFFEFGVTDDAAVVPANQDVAITIPSSEPDGNRAMAVTVHGLFEVEAGTNFFAFLGRQLEGLQISDVLDVQFTAIYFATTYGAVTGTAIRPSDREDVAMTSVAGSSRGSTTSVERELAALRRELSDLRAQLGLDAEGGR